MFFTNFTGLKNESEGSACLRKSTFNPLARLAKERRENVSAIFKPYHELPAVGHHFIVKAWRRHAFASEAQEF